MGRRVFRFISQDDKVNTMLRTNFKRYRIINFSFELLTPYGNIMTRETNYLTMIDGEYTALNTTLTALVLRHAPKWYEKYIDVMPVKVLDLKVEGK